jgi:hypothetical protein
MSNQQRKKAPWMGLSPSQPPMKKKKKRPPWLRLILVAFSGIVIVIIAFNVAMHWQSNSILGTIQAGHSSTPTPDLTTLRGMEQYTLHLAQNSGTSGIITSSNFDPGVRGVVITETVGDEADHTAFRATIEHDCFFIQQAIWKSNINIAAVEVHILGPLIDSQGDTKTGPIGICGLKEQTEQKFAWNNLTINQAWSHYDAIWMLPALNKSGDLRFSQQEA